MNHILTHWKTSLSGLLIAVTIVASVFLQQGVTLGNAGTGTVIGLIAACATALLGFIARDPGTDVTAAAPSQQKLGLLLIVAMLLCAALQAQTTAAPAGFVASTDALAISANGAWGAGNLTTEAYDLFDYGPTKSNRLFAQGVELTAPGAGLSIFGGGVIWQPDLSALLKNTNLPVGNFTFFADASLGNGIPSTGADRISWIAGAGVKYILSDNLTWNTVRFEEVGFGANRYPAISMGLSAYFGGTPASAAVSSNVRASLVRRIAAATRAVVKQ